MATATAAPQTTLELWQLDLKYAALRICDPHAVSALAASLERHGQLAPVLAIPTEPKPILIDGFVRISALRRCGRDTVTVLLLPLSETEALTWSYRQRRGRRPTALEEGWLVETLLSDHEQSLPTIAARLERSTSWVSRRLGLVRELPSEIQERVRRGTLSAYAAMRSLLPLARTNVEGASQLAQIACQEQLTTRQLDRLCAAWRAATPDQRQQLLQHPRGYLQLDEHVSHQKAQRAARPTLVRDFETLAAITQRSTRVLCDASRRDQAGATEAMLVVWPRVASAFRRLAQAVEDHTHAQA